VARDKFVLNQTLGRLLDLERLTRINTCLLPMAFVMCRSLLNLSSYEFVYVTCNLLNFAVLLVDVWSLSSTVFI
jgi:hypothetical protein